MSEMTDACDENGRATNTRIDAMHRALPTWQQGVLWFVTITVGLRVPQRVTSAAPERGLLAIGLILGLYAGQTLAFSWFNGRWD